MEAGKDTNQNSAITSHQFQFTGNGAEYFKIWIVNLLLSIITLGIYSAWAKVRTNRYFYGNTHLDGSTFDYLANPISILKGRLVAVALLAIYIAISSFMPGMEIIFILMLFLISPWLIVKALAFKAQNSAYRNIRFDFLGTTANAAKSYILLPLLAIPTLGLLFPYVRFKQTQFSVENHVFGQEKFTFKAQTGDYYKVFLVVFLAFIVFMTINFGILSDLSNANVEQDPEAAAKAMLAIVPFMYAFFGLIAVYVQVKLLNILYSNSQLGEAFELSSDYKVGRMLWIHVSNLVAVVFTLGLFYPWAKVRIAKYKAEKIQLNARADLDSFTSKQIEKAGATGDEIGEIFAVDLAI